jgi:PTH1 family peptidyl-tRNA hydrolase
LLFRNKFSFGDFLQGWNLKQFGNHYFLVQSIFKLDKETRHNIGFMVIDALAARMSIPLKKKTTDYMIGRGFIGEQKVILIKPLTFMNRSGIAVRDVLWKNEDIENVLIIHDDLDLEPGVIRIKKTGSSGGHNGIQSIIDFLHSKAFVRLKVGIGRPKRGSAERYVLKRFSKQERPVIEEAVETAADAVSVILNKGISKAQNQFHTSHSK